MQETYEAPVPLVGRKDSLEQGIVIHSSILAGESHG